MISMNGRWVVWSEFQIREIQSSERKEKRRLIYSQICNSPSNKLPINYTHSMIAYPLPIQQQHVVKLKSSVWNRQVCVKMTTALNFMMPPSSSERLLLLRLLIAIVILNTLFIWELRRLYLRWIDGWNVDRHTKKEIPLCLSRVKMKELWQQLRNENR